MSLVYAIPTRALPAVAERAHSHRAEQPPLERAHQVAVSLAAARARVVLPLAKVAAAVAGGKVHRDFGHASLEDFCRERHGRGGRWVRDLAVLQGHFERLPALAAAVSGGDGKPPLHVSAAMAIGAVAARESVNRWIALGREVPLARLRSEIRAEAGSDAVEPEQVQVRLAIPPVVRAAFDETLELYRAVVGYEANVASFIEAMVAEAMTEPEPPAMDGIGGPAEGLVRERDGSNMDDLPRAVETSAALKLAGSSLEQLAHLMEVAGTGDTREIDRQLAELLRLQNVLELRLGQVLLDMGEMRGWRRLGFQDAGHYAERVLSMSRTAAEDRVRVAGAIRPYALVRQAYERGDLTWEATRSVLRLMKGADPRDLEGQRSWIAHGRSCTVKRLRDEAKARCRAEALEGRIGPVEPMTDDGWHGSLRLEPGTATQRMAEFGARLLNEAERQTARSRMDVTVMRLRLPEELAADFMRVVRLRHDVLKSKACGAPEPEEPASVRVTRTFSTRGWWPPLWVGLLGLLEDCIRLWEPQQAGVGGPDKRELFARSGYRCSAPGCTRRATLEDHHLVFLSVGGGPELTNRESLCWFHHHAGIHGGLAEARGEAPLGVTWRLGRNGMGGRFRNEKRL